MLDLGDVEGPEEERRGGIRILGDQDIRKPGHQGIRISEHQDEEIRESGYQEIRVSSNQDIRGFINSNSRNSKNSINPINSMNSTNPSNPLNKVLLLCRAEVLQLNYLTATLRNRSTAAPQHRCTIKLWFKRLVTRHFVSATCHLRGLS